ncbi:MAG: ATP-dependent 6-phosphofructokinase [Candidatus Aureabacteria bacterium]|nr:ATP-dependent 6-phosphofructokinase [Candidatus Auribacterota bacterium]
MNTPPGIPDLSVSNLGKRKIPSPIVLSNKTDDYIAGYVSDDQFVLYRIAPILPGTPNPFKKEELLEPAGPREHLFFDPNKVHAGIVTCGGLCPGLNDVIRSVVMTLWYHYGVRRISGIRYGYRGLLPCHGLPFMELNPETVSEIHLHGGTILGSSRGEGERVDEMTDFIEKMHLNILFTIGGDGTLRGAMALCREIAKRDLKISVIGIPKTIDNDLNLIQKSFGFETAVSQAVHAVAAAHVEAHDSVNGIGIVKVMGRESGFIAAHTTLATNEVNFVLIPEVPFDLEGENGLLIHLQKRLERRKHAVILAAEGAGQDLTGDSGKKDASGNKKLTDIGLFLKQKISDYFRSLPMEINLKYIDPSYMIRSSAATPNDSVYCNRLGSNAVHAAMAGKTNTIISLVNNHFVHVPIAPVVSKRNKIDPEGPLWRDVVQATGQPALMKNMSVT